MLTFGAWWPRSTSEKAFGPELARAVVARAPVVEHGRVEGRLVELVLDEHAEAVGQRRVDRAQALEVALERAAEVDLAREVPAVADPDRVRARAELHARARGSGRCARPPARRTAGSAWVRLPNLYEQLLPGLVLERVRVHRVEEEPARRRVRLELGRALGLVPRDVQRDARASRAPALDRPRSRRASRRRCAARPGPRSARSACRRCRRPTRAPPRGTPSPAR